MYGVDCVLVLGTSEALIENACAATTMIAHRWSRRVNPGDLIFVLDCVYGACRMCLQEYCCADPRIGGKIVALSIFEQHGSFPKTSAEILARFRESLEQQIETTCQVTSMQFCHSSLVYVLLKFSRHAYKAALQNQICSCLERPQALGGLELQPRKHRAGRENFFSFWIMCRRSPALFCPWRRCCKKSAAFSVLVQKG